jgi:hypothetical protein
MKGGRGGGGGGEGVLLLKMISNMYVDRKKNLKKLMLSL